MQELCPHYVVCKVLEMMEEDSHITEFLDKLVLQKYRDKFIAEGPLCVKSVGEFSRFLSDPNSLKGVGMTVFEVNRFKRLCRKTIQVEL